MEKNKKFNQFEKTCHINACTAGRYRDYTLDRFWLPPTFIKKEVVENGVLV